MLTTADPPGDGRDGLGSPFWGGYLMEQLTLVSTPTLTWHSPIRPPADPVERARLFHQIGWFPGDALIGIVAGQKTVVIRSHSEGAWQYRADIWLPGCQWKMGTSIEDAKTKAESVVAQFIEDNPGYWDGSQAA